MPGPDPVKGIMASGPPFQSRLSKDLEVQKSWEFTCVPLTYEPPVGVCGYGSRETLETEVHEEPSRHVVQKELARNSVNVLRISVLLGTAEASSHAPYDEVMVACLRQAGVKVEHWRVEDFSIRGTGHMQILEVNSMEARPSNVCHKRESARIQPVQKALSVA